MFSLKVFTTIEEGKMVKLLTTGEIAEIISNKGPVNYKVKIKNKKEITTICYKYVELVK